MFTGLASTRTRRQVLVVSIVLVLALASFVVPRFSDIGPSSNALKLASKQDPTSNGAKAYGDLPLSIEPNAGQTDPSVRFMAHAQGGILYFAQSEVVLSLRDPSSTDDPLQRRDKIQGAGMGRGPGLAAPAPDDAATSSPPTVLRVQFHDTNPKSHLESGEGLPGKVSYFVGKDPSKWHTGLPTYGAVSYRGLYPGIDLSYSGAGGELKGTYTVAPGANPTSIRWRYQGADRVSVDSAGNLQVQLGGSGDITVREQAPVAWQEIGGRRVSVDVRYAVGKAGEVRFGVGRYDQAYPLTLDPTLVYSTFLGGSGYEHGYGIAVDSAGNAYIAGQTISADFPTLNPYQPNRRGNIDAFITKLSASGSALIYSTYLGGSNTYYCCQEGAYAIAVDSDGDAYVTGYSESSDFPLVNPFQSTNTGTGAFVTKLNPSGSALLYSTYLGGSGVDRGYGIAVDGSESAYVAGTTFSSDFPTASPYQASLHGQTDAFVTKFTPSGSALVYSTYLGGAVGSQLNGLDDAYAIAVDGAGSAYITGRTFCSDFPIYNAIIPTFSGGQYAFVTKFTPAGTALVYSTYLGGSSGNQEQQGYGIAADGAGNAYVTGTTYSSDFPLVNAYQTTNYGQQVAFLTKFNISGSAILYSTYFGGSISGGPNSPLAQGQGIAVNQVGDVFVAGATNVTDLPLRNAYMPYYGGGRTDAFVARFDPNAVGDSSLVFSTYLGSGGDDFGRSIAVDRSDDAYVSGDAGSGEFPIVNAFQSVYAGGGDVFVAKFSPADGPPIATRTPTPTVTSTNTATVTRTPLPDCGAYSDYVFTQSTRATVVPGTLLVPGSQCDECTVMISLPFTYSLYELSSTTAIAGDNGTLDLLSNSDPYANSCLPTTYFNYAILPHWDDLDMRAVISPALGIYTSVSGIAPDRIFNIEWRASLFGVTASTANFEVRLYEGQNRFDLVYGDVTNSGSSATIGVQRTAGPRSTQFSCFTSSLIPGLELTFTQLPCGATPTPSNTPTASVTSSVTPTYTPASTPTFTVTPAPATTSTATPTSTPSTSLLIGHVTWQGPLTQPNVRQELPVTLTLSLGGVEVNYASQNTDTSGFFTVAVGSLANGTYNWRSKGPKYLANCGTVTLAGAPTTRQEMGLLRAGDTDATHNNVVNGTDFTALKNVFGTSSSVGDLNNDGVTNGTDFTLLKGNFGTAGCGPVLR